MKDLNNIIRGACKADGGCTCNDYIKQENLSSHKCEGCGHFGYDHQSIQNLESG